VPERTLEPIDVISLAKVVGVIGIQSPSYPRRSATRPGETETSV